MTNTVIDIDELSHAFGDATVLDGLELSVESGELIGLVGPNGAGKSTLLRTVSGALSPGSGRVELAGDPVSELSSKATSRRVAVVPQSTAVSFSFPVRDVVAMGRHPYRGRFDRGLTSESIVDRAMARTEVEQFADRPIDELSGGERQRVILARAIAQDTPGLLLDEPTSNLDINHQIETLETVRSLIDDGKAGFAAIHDLDLAARYCDRIALLSGGTFIAVGAPADVLTPDRVSAAFDTDVAVAQNPVTDGLSVAALAETENRNQTVHVLGYGTAAARLVGTLSRAGYSVTAGPVPRGDRVVDVTEALNGDVLVTEPYQQTDTQIVERAESWLDAADVTCVAVDGYSSGLDTVLDVARTAGRVVPVSVDGSVPLAQQFQNIANPVHIGDVPEVELTSADDSVAPLERSGMSE